jgi:hypothetical protein
MTIRLISVKGQAVTAYEEIEQLAAEALTGSMKAEEDFKRSVLALPSDAARASVELFPSFHALLVAPATPPD